MRCAFVGSLWYRSAPCMAAECVAVRVECKKQGERQKVVHQINTKHHPQARRLQVFDHSLFLISSAPVPPAPGLDLVRQFFESILGLAGQGSRASLGLLVDVDEAGRGKWKNDERERRGVRKTGAQKTKRARAPLPPWCAPEHRRTRCWVCMRLSLTTRPLPCTRWQSRAWTAKARPTPFFLRHPPFALFSLTETARSSCSCRRRRRRRRGSRSRSLTRGCG
jgi:hypothetical protein